MSDLVGNPEDRFSQNEAQIFAVITLKVFHREICPKGAYGMANSVDLDQTAPREKQSDLDLHCLQRPI